MSPRDDQVQADGQEDKWGDGVEVPEAVGLHGHTHSDHTADREEDGQGDFRGSTDREKREVGHERVGEHEGGQGQLHGFHGREHHRRLGDGCGGVARGCSGLAMAEIAQRKITNRCA